MKEKKNFPTIKVKVFCISIFMIPATFLLSQDSSGRKRKIPFYDTLPKIHVIGFINQGKDIKARLIELGSVSILTSLSSERFEKSADLSVADIAQRITGLSVIKNSLGESEKIMIRGIDPKYSYTQVNGLLLPSADDRERNQSLILFPSAMIARFEIHKTLTADIEGGAIGGGINLVLKEAPNEKLLETQVATDYDGIYFKRNFEKFNYRSVSLKSPAEIYGSLYQAKVNDFSKDNLYFQNKKGYPGFFFNFTLGERILKKKLGYIFSAVYSNKETGSNGIYIPQNAQPQVGNLPNLTDFMIRQYDMKGIIIGLQNKWDYVISPGNRISLLQMFVQKKDIESRFITDTSLMQGRSIPGTGRIAFYQRSRMHLQNVYTVQLVDEQQLNQKWSLQLKLAYDVAKGQFPDWAELVSTKAHLLQPNGFVSETPLILSPLLRFWQRNKEQDFSITPTLKYKKAIHAILCDFQLGGLYRAKWKSNFYNSYNFIPALTSSLGQPFTNIYEAQWLKNEPQNPLGSLGNNNTFSATEEIIGVFFQSHFKKGKLDIYPGIRWESTQQEISGSVNPLPGVGPDVSIVYNDYLPSVHLNYFLSESWQIKAAYFKGIARPSLYDLSFYSINYEGAAVVGNPFLERTIADNFDIRADFQPLGKKNFQIGLFLKNLHNPFEKALLNVNDELYPIPSQGLYYTPANQLTEQVRNFGNAKLLGLEFMGRLQIKPFTISANYTYTYSHLLQDKKFQTRDIPGNSTSNIITVNKKEERPLQGQSPHNANFSVGYENRKIGLDIQMAFVYIGKRIYSVSGWYGLDYWQMGMLNSDFSFQKKIGRHWQVFGSIRNFFRSPMRVFINQPNPDWGIGLLPGQINPNRILVQEEANNLNFRLGVKFKVIN